MLSYSPAFQLAADFIHYTNRPVFLTGKAGTGKTTFLKHIKEHTSKHVAVLAPTGVAAINAGGVTIHSFFQLPFTPFVPSSRGFTNNDTIDKHDLIGRIRMNNERRKILRQLELLIIDEVSMVRCDTMDAIDTLLRHFRSSHEPFGGVQVLLIGDMYQLSPVVPDAEWQLLSGFYQSPYFFDSNVIQEQSPVYVELDKIYRQDDEQFISVLNQVRNNNMDETGLRLLQTLYQPTFRPGKDDGYITLTTHNKKADAINAAELSRLDAKTLSFKAVIDGEFSEKSYPADELLQLKAGAQVMFIKNDTEKIRRYFNGKIGTIQKIDPDSISVQCKEGDIIEVRKETWKNIRYALNKSTQKVEEEEIGSFSQYPLRLAWAITIHKSQGLSFERLVIDAGSAFAPGQVYVALSRAISLKGLVLHSQINTHSLHTDKRIMAFAKNNLAAKNLQDELKAARDLYQRSVLLSLFDYEQALTIIVGLIDFVEERPTSFNPETILWLKELKMMAIDLQDVSKKFHPHLQVLLQSDSSLKENEPLQKKLIAAAGHFIPKTDELLRFLSRSPAVTDSKQAALGYNEELKDIFSALAQKANIIGVCRNGFSIEAYHQVKNNFILPPFYVNAYAGDAAYKKSQSAHPILHRQLRELRDDLCNKKNMAIYMIAGSATLDELVNYLPQTMDELSKISGFGKVKTEKYGALFLDIIKRYCDQHDLSSLVHEKSPKRERKEKSTSKPDTKLESFKLYREGKTAQEIATARNLAPQTIEGHLAHFVQSGDIKIDELLSSEKVALIEPFLKNFEGKAITPIKEQLGDAASFGEIRLVLAWLEFKKGS